MSECVTWGITCSHNKVCIGGAPHFELGGYSKYSACLTPSVWLLSWKNVAIFLKLLLWGNSRVLFWIKHVCLTSNSCLPWEFRLFIATAKTCSIFGLSWPTYLEVNFSLGGWRGLGKEQSFIFLPFFLSSQEQRCIFVQSYRKTSYVFGVKSSTWQDSYFSNLISTVRRREGKKCFLAYAKGCAVYSVAEKRVLLLFLCSSKGHGIRCSLSAFLDCLVITPDCSIKSFYDWWIQLFPIKNPP